MSDSIAPNSSDEVPSNHDYTAGEGDAERRDEGDPPRDRDRVESEPGVEHPATEPERPGSQGLERSGTSVEEFDDSEQAIPGVELALQASFRGPIPPPNILQGYEDISPGFADRIISMAEDSLRADTHIELIDRRAEAFALKVATVGVTFFPWVAIICATILAMLGYPVAALLTGATGLLVAGPQIIAAVRRTNSDE